MSNELNMAMVSQLKDFIRRIQNIKDEQDALAIDLKDLYKEVSGEGFDVAIIKSVIKELRMDSKEREKEEQDKELVNIYLRAVNGDKE